MKREDLARELLGLFQGHLENTNKEFASIHNEIAKLRLELELHKRENCMHFQVGTARWKWLAALTTGILGVIAAAIAMLTGK